MASDEDQIVGKWNLSFRGQTGSWKWEYTFSTDRTVMWRDPLNGMSGLGRWLKQGNLINIVWQTSTTKESWYCPINPSDQKGWIDASYGTGNFQAQKLVASASPNQWMGVPITMLASVAMDEFCAGFRTGAANQISDQWILNLQTKVLADPNGFQLGYAKGVLSGLLSGLKNLFTSIIDIFKLAMSLSPVAMSVRATQEAWFLLTDAAHRELRKKQIDQAQKIASALETTIDDVNRHPGDYIVLSKEVGDAVGRIAGQWFTADFLNKTAPEIGEVVGTLIGLVLFEIILQIVIALTTAEAGNAARAASVVGEGARGGSRVGRLVELLKPLLMRLKGLQKLLRLLSVEERGASALEALLKGFNEIERGIITEARLIYRSTEMIELRKAAAAGKDFEATIGGRFVGYSPDLPYSGNYSAMTYFEKDGFHLGPHAFKSEDEVAKTLLQELHRLRTSKIRGTAEAVGVASETRSADALANAAFNVVLSGP